MDTCRLRVKIGSFEMEAEGPRDFVENHYTSFSQRIPEPSNNLALRDSVTRRDDNASLGLPAGEERQAVESEFARIFHQDDKGVSLTLIPHGENAELDAFLLLLLGYKEMQGADLVSADELIYGLRQSGFASLERADRIADRGAQQGYVHKSGVKRGTRYRITNLGIARGRKLAQDLLQEVA